MSEGEVGWFVCLITGVSKPVKENNNAEENGNRGIPRKKWGKRTTGVPKKQSDVKRTIVLASSQPIKVLLLMNAGEDDNIVSAAEKAIKSRRLLDSSDLIDEKGLRKRFEFVCMLGPIPNKTLAHQILASWERSRGSISRTTTACIIANLFNIKFSINWEVLLDTKSRNRKVHVINSSIKGDSTLYIYTPQESSNSVTIGSTLDFISPSPSLIEKRNEVCVKEEHQIRPLSVIKKEKKS
jgi:hypothetical protein